MLHEDKRIPKLFRRGRATYSANLNATNPVGTVQSIEHALRNLDKLATEQQNRVTRIQKELADYQLQADRPFEHERHMKQLLVRQVELNSLFDLDKGDQQAGDSAPDHKVDPQVGRSPPATSRDRDEVAKRADEYMLTSGTAILEMHITVHRPPPTGPVSGRAVAKDEERIAVATAANSYFVIPSTSLDREVQAGERLSLRFHQGRVSIDSGRDRGR